MKRLLVIGLLLWSVAAFADEGEPTPTPTAPPPPRLKPLAYEGNSYFNFSPDGGQFLYADSQQGEIWIYNFASKAAQRVVTLRSGDESKQSTRIVSPFWVKGRDEIVFVSYDDTASASGLTQVFGVRPDGAEFHSITQFIRPPDLDPVREPLLTPFIRTWRLMILAQDAKGGGAMLESMELTGANHAPFAWQKGILASRWDADQHFLAYASAGAPDAASSKLTQLWVMRNDGGQLKKVSSSLAWPKDRHPVPLSWSPEGKHLGFMNEQLDERLQTFREVVTYEPTKSIQRVVFKTWGTPLSPIYWNARGEKMAFLERDGAGKVFLVTIDLKIRGGQVVDRKDVTRVELPAGSVLVGWDPESPKHLFVLNPKSTRVYAWFSLQRQPYDKPTGDLWQADMPADAQVSVDALRHRIVSCGTKWGCVLVATADPKVEWITPSFQTTLGAGDFHLRIGKFDRAKEFYRSLSSEGLERDRLLTLETRYYLTAQLAGQEEQGKEIWTGILAQIERGETQPQDYLRVGKALSDVGESQQALEVLRKVLDQYPNSPEAKEALLESGRLYRDRGEYEFAQNCFGNFVRLYPKEKRANAALLELADTLLLSQHPGKAIKVYRKVLGVARDDGERFRAYLGKARSLEKMNLFTDAAKTYRLLLDAKTDKTTQYDSLFEEAAAGLARLEKM